MPCLVQYDRFLRDENDFYLIHENYQVRTLYSYAYDGSLWDD